MLLKIKRFFKSLFSKNFIHPEINKRINTAIDDKIAGRVKAQSKETEKHTAFLNSLLRTYFSKQYDSPEMMKVSFDLCNKEWQTLVRDINSKSKLINLNKHAFSNKVKLVIKNINENGTNKK